MIAVSRTSVVPHAALAAYMSQHQPHPRIRTPTITNSDSPPLPTTRGLPIAIATTLSSPRHVSVTSLLHGGVTSSLRSPTSLPRFSVTSPLHFNIALPRRVSLGTSPQPYLALLLKLLMTTSGCFQVCKREYEVRRGELTWTKVGELPWGRLVWTKPQQMWLTEAEGTELMFVKRL
ncbi:hypothetical protein BV22DRAFT_929186 [Leucogyrophana mollusca]|uniref:Uncharacterized protein n=1 Tax=Leucogyrophana mollusca TaxID=85980 RepID=A0ACB8AX03_9AGAM|nr:hypothetical protein BV22DRAFT_929186 [Leucogyrophana mollusca]